MSLNKKIGLPLIPLILATVIMELLVQKGFVASYLLPAPSEILLSFKEDSAEYLKCFQQTLVAAVLGLCLSVVFGITISVLLSTSKLVEQAFYPYAVFFQTVPIVSIAPLLVIWFGFGVPTVIASAFIVSVFPVVANTLAGMRSASPNLTDLFQIYNASSFDRLLKLRLPFAVPQIVTGVRIASGLAMIGAIVGEFIAGGGLGGLIDIAQTQQRLDKVFAAILIASFLGILVVTVINTISKLALKRWGDI